MLRLLLPLLIGALASCTTPPAPSGRDPGGGAILLSGGFVVDPSREQPATRADVLILGDRIAAVGARLRPPAGVRRIDVSGAYLVPGLWDMHAHVAVEGTPGAALDDYVRHGVLAIRDMGGLPDEIFRLRADVQAGRRLGPTMMIAGPTLNGEQPAPHHRLIANEAEARAAVHELAGRDVDFIKIHRRTSREAFYGVRDQARADRLLFAGHVPLALDWIEASNAGMATIEHVQTIIENEMRPGMEPIPAAFDALDRLDAGRADAIFAAMARNGTYWDPTLIYYETSWRDATPERRALQQRAYARLRPYVLRAFNAGVPILAGTDLFVDPGQGLIDELDRLVAAGLTPRQALAAATTNPHRLFGRGPGAIGPGTEASLLVLRSDPTMDLRALRSIERIILRGRLLPAR
jgi:imidazolonepropionase-like amidohydrolase